MTKNLGLADRLKAELLTPGEMVDERPQSTTDRLLDAAAQRFADVGIDATAMSSIAAEADLSREWLYRHFPTGMPSSWRSCNARCDQSVLERMVDHEVRLASADFFRELPRRPRRIRTVQCHRHRRDVDLTRRLDGDCSVGRPRPSRRGSSAGSTPATGPAPSRLGVLGDVDVGPGIASGGLTDHGDGVDQPVVDRIARIQFYDRE